MLQNKKYLILFTAIFLFFSFILHKSVSHVDSYQDIDSKAYISNATRLAKTGSVVMENGPKDIPYYALGYAFFVGLIYKVFGINNALVTWIQVFLALLTIFLIFRVTGYLFDKRVALIAFVFGCLNVGFLTFSQFILTEILLTFLLVFFFERFVLFAKTKQFFHLIQSFALGDVS